MMWVKYLQHMGEDLTPAHAARISFDQDHVEREPEKDHKLIGYLANHEHYSCFEHQVVTVEVYCPIPIAMQIMRHRTFAYNMVSRRYTSENIEFYTPDHFSKQAEKNKQASDGLVTDDVHWHFRLKLEQLYDSAELLYDEMICAGVSREEARFALPQGLYCRFIMTGNVRNWSHFVKLRKHHAAQKQVQFIATEVEAILKNLFPVTMEALCKPNGGHLASLPTPARTPAKKKTKPKRPLKKPSKESLKRAKNN